MQQSPTRRDFIPKDLNDPSLKWGESNVKWSYTVLAQLESEMAEKPVSVLFKHGGLAPRFHEDHIVFYGTKGAIYIKGHYGSGQLYHFGADKTWVPSPLPQDIVDGTPDVPGETEKCWHYMVREFLRDIQGKTVPPYPTLKEGSEYQQYIDVIRRKSTRP